MSFCKVERSLGLRISCLSALGIHSSGCQKGSRMSVEAYILLLGKHRENRVFAAAVRERRG